MTTPAPHDRLERAPVALANVRIPGYRLIRRLPGPENHERYAGRRLSDGCDVVIALFGDAPDHRRARTAAFLAAMARCRHPGWASTEMVTVIGDARPKNSPPMFGLAWTNRADLLASSWVEQGRGARPRLLALWADALITTLAAAHEQHLYHGLISADLVQLGGDGDVHLGGFGLALAGTDEDCAAMRVRDWRSAGLLLCRLAEREHATLDPRAPDDAYRGEFRRWAGELAQSGEDHDSVDPTRRLSALRHIPLPAQAAASEPDTDTLDAFLGRERGLKSRLVGMVRAARLAWPAAAALGAVALAAVGLRELRDQHPPAAPPFDPWTEVPPQRVESGSRDREQARRRFQDRLAALESERQWMPALRLIEEYSRRYATAGESLSALARRDALLAEHQADQRREAVRALRQAEMVASAGPYEEQAAHLLDLARSRLPETHQEALLARRDAFRAAAKERRDRQWASLQSDAGTDLAALRELLAHAPDDQAREALAQRLEALERAEPTDDRAAKDPEASVPRQEALAAKPARETFAAIKTLAARFHYQEALQLLEAPFADSDRARVAYVQEALRREKRFVDHVLHRLRLGARRYRAEEFLEPFRMNDGFRRTTLDDVIGDDPAQAVLFFVDQDTGARREIAFGDLQAQEMLRLLSRLAFPDDPDERTMLFVFARFRDLPNPTLPDVPAAQRLWASNFAKALAPP